MLTRRARLAVTAAALAGLLVTTTGCAQLAETFNSMQAGGAPQVTPTAPEDDPDAPDATFESQFTRDGSVSLSTDIADNLEVRLDVWAVDPKQTLKWHPSNPKTFGFAVNVHDHRVDEKAVLTEKRRVYISHIAITSQTTQTSQQTSSPFQFAADPRTLVPADTLRSERGLLLNSFQGGLLVPEATIHQLPPDTYGITLQFAITVAVEGTANTESSFQDQVVYQVLPITILPETGSLG